jgi:hypothetical protein
MKLFDGASLAKMFPTAPAGAVTAWLRFRHSNGAKIVVAFRLADYEALFSPAIIPQIEAGLAYEHELDKAAIADAGLNLLDLEDITASLPQIAPGMIASILLSGSFSHKIAAIRFEDWAPLWTVAACEAIEAAHLVVAARAANQN